MTRSKKPFRLWPTTAENNIKPHAAARLTLLAFTLAFAIPFGAGTLHGESTEINAPAAMHARYDKIRDQLNNNQFGQPFHITSELKDHRVSGELSALIEHPFEIVTSAFKSAGNWCDIMMLHHNFKYCSASGKGADQVLTIYVGRKHFQPLDSAFLGEYIYRVLNSKPDYFNVTLASDNGPLKTKNYYILLEAVPLNHLQTFIHITYSYEFGALARAAQTVYFHTVGRKKVGFTVVDEGPDGQPVHVGGLRGALERNIMRYYLAIKAYLDALQTPQPERLEKRLQGWFALTECYPLQLREQDKNDYMNIKKQEYKRLKSR